MPEAQILKSREYETIYILRSDVDADTAEKVQARVAEVVGRDNGKLVKVESWGRRKLAYPVAKQRKGVYVFVKYVGRGGLVQELERNLKLSDSVLKFQTIQTNDEVDAASINVDPAEVKFERLELPVEAEEAESREKQLGLIDLGPDAPRSMRDRGDDEYGDADGAEMAEGDESPNSVPGPGGGAAAAAPAAAPAATPAAEKPTTGGGNNDGEPS
jgi:small subunit ribosomal protein S6